MMLYFAKYARTVIVLVTALALMLPGAHYFYRAAEAAPMNMPTMFRCEPGSLWHHYYTEPFPFPGLPHYCLRAEEIGHEVATWASAVDGSRFIVVLLLIVAALHFAHMRLQTRGPVQ
ncbi:MAG: hypothetical protein AAFY99_06670 [Pseudomonadota bacterium]